jgi:type I restriction-modification system DNA methylase subunit
MTWIAPSEKDTDNAALEERLGDAADQFRANSGLKSQEYFLAPWERVAAPAFSGPVQGSPTGRDEFAMSKGQGGGESYSPISIVRLLTEVIEPYHGRILDPACVSGGMFVSSARFVSEHSKARWRITTEGKRRFDVPETQQSNNY